MPIKIDFISNVRDLLRGTKDAERAFDEVADSLDDVARDGDDSLGRLERSFKDVAKQARKTDDEVSKLGGGGSGFIKAGDASSEFKDEALANFSEVTSSFDGSMESVGELAQGTLGGVAQALPGLGLAAGVVAAGIGGITSRLTELGDENKRIKEGIIADAIELGDALDKEAVDARVRDILGSENTRKQAQLLMEILEVNLGEAALIMAGDVNAAGTTVEEVMRRVNEASGNVNYDTWIDLKNTIDSTTDALEGAEQAAHAQAEAERLTAAASKESQSQVRSEAAKTKAQLDAWARGGGYKIPVDVDVSGAYSRFDQLRRDLQSRGINVPIRTTGLNSGREAV